MFADGRAMVSIDVDMAHPTDRVSQVCDVLLRWAPLIPTSDREVALRDVGPISRAALLVDSYGRDPIERAQVVPVARNGAERAWYSMRDRAAQLGGGWRRMWDEGVSDRILRRQDWLAANAAALQESVAG